MDINKIYEAAQAVELPEISAVSTRSSSLSFGVVNSKRNGKCISLSAGLVSAMGITDKAAILPVQSENVILVAKELPELPAAHEVALKGGRSEEAKIAYDAKIVAILTEVFGLNFTGHVSRTFSNICIETLDGKPPIAVISVDGRHSGESDTAAEEQ